MHWLNHMQWWSFIYTHLWHIEQWEVPHTLTIWHCLHFLTSKFKLFLNLLQSLYKLVKYRFSINFISSSELIPSVYKSLSSSSLFKLCFLLYISALFNEYLWVFWYKYKNCSLVFSVIYPGSVIQVIINDIKLMK